MLIEFNKKETKMNIKNAIIALVTLGAALSFSIMAESTVVTKKGTFKCPNACVVGDDGSVTDSEGGVVWKKVVNEIDG